MPVPGLRWRISLAASMPSRWNVGGMRMSLTTTCGWCSSGGGEQLGVVGGLAHDLDVGLPGQQGAHAGAHDEVVIGQDHGDHAVGHGVHRARSGGAGARGQPCDPEGVPAPPLRRRSAPLGASGRGRWMVRRKPTQGARDEDRVEGRRRVLDPVRGGEGRHEGALRAGDRPLRPAAAGRARRPRGLAASGTCSAWPTTCGRGSTSTTTARSSATATRGGGVIGSTTMGLGRRVGHLPGRGLPRPAGRARGGDGWVRFTQTAGGRTGVPAPRRVAKPPFVQYHAPTAWSTLSLTIHADGRAELGPRRCQPVPAPLGLRPRRRAGRQVRPGRLQGLVPPRLRRLQPVGRRGLAGAGDGGRVGHGAPAVPGDHGRGQAEGPQAEGGRRAHRAGRGGRRHLPAARRRHPGAGRRRGDRQPRPGRADRRAGGARGRAADGHARRRVAVQGRRGPQGGARPGQAGRGQRGPPARGAGPRREGARARRAGLDPGTRARLRAPRRQHVLRRAGSRRRAAEPACSTPAPGIRGLGRAARESGRSAARCCSATCTGTTPRACRSRAPSTTTAPRCGSASPTRTTATPPSTCCAGPCRRRTSRSGPRACGARGPSRASSPASTTSAASRCWRWRSRTRAAAPSATASATGARRSPTCPTTARRRSARVPTAGGRTTTPRWRWPRTSTC